MRSKDQQHFMQLHDIPPLMHHSWNGHTCAAESHASPAKQQQEQKPAQAERYAKGESLAGRVEDIAPVGHVWAPVQDKRLHATIILTRCMQICA